MNLFKLFILFPLLLIMFNTYADDEDTKPTIKPIVKIFSNYHFGLNEYSNKNGFEINRAYLGFAVKLSDNLSFKTNIDVGNPKNGSAYELTVYLKTAALTYKKNNFTVNFGLIGLKQFKLQETVWGHRYVYKSFQDQHKFGHSADFGLILDYKIIDNLSVDATIRNGEGYKELQSDDTYRGALGLTYYITDDLFLRGVYDVTSKSVTQTVISGLIAYNFKDVLLTGIEYSSLTNNDFIDNENKSGFSVYSSFDISDKFQIFGRFDKLGSNTLSGDTERWNIAKDGQAIIAGVQYKMDKKVKVAASLQQWNSSDNITDKQVYVYINLEYKF